MKNLQQASIYSSSLLSTASDLSESSFRVAMAIPAMSITSEKDITMPPESIYPASPATPITKIVITSRTTDRTRPVLGEERHTAKKTPLKINNGISTSIRNKGVGSDARALVDQRQDTAKTENRNDRLKMIGLIVRTNECLYQNGEPSK